MVAKMASEKSSYTMTELPGGLIRCQVDSKYMPIDDTFKLGEEFTMDFPGMGKHTCIETLVGDTLVNVSKGPKFTSKSWTKFGENFVVTVSVKISCCCFSNNTLCIIIPCVSLFYFRAAILMERTSGTRQF